MASQVSFNNSQLYSDAPKSSIKDLCSPGTLSSLPSSYIVKDSQATDVEYIAEDVEFPVVDFSLLTKGTPDQQSQVVQDMGKACKEWGFFMLVNHGVPAKLRNSLMNTFKGFFDLPAEDKQFYADTHVMNPIRYGTSVNTKVDEVRYWRDYVKIITHPEFHCPTDPPQFRNVLQEYAACTRELGMKLLGAIWESLGLDKNCMNETLNLDSSFQIVICNLYPPCPQPELAMGLPPHSDHGLLSILYQNDVDGLELKHSGKWVRVKPLPNSYFINTGDHMEIVSNGKYKSIVHRASVNRQSTRMSILSIASPSLDTIVAPASQLLSLESPAAFRAMRYREFMEHQQTNKIKEKSALDLLRV